MKYLNKWVLKKKKKVHMLKKIRIFGWADANSGDDIEFLIIYGFFPLICY